MHPSSTKTSAIELREARSAADFAVCRELLQEYQHALGVSLCFQGFDRELAGLPGDYAPPRGRLVLAMAGATPAGCIALRPLGTHEAEMKRLYVRPAFRGTGLGERLARHVIDEAALLGYRVLKLDTLPTMAAAQRLYRRLGFAETAPYNDNPVDGVRFMAVDLAGRTLTS